MGHNEIAEEIAKDYNLTLIGRDAFRHSQLVEAIEAGIQTALAEQGWRRVTDELPPEGGPGDWVFVWTLGAQMHIGFRRAGAWYLPSAAPVESTVTHWRPRFGPPPGQSWRGKK